MKDKNKTPRPIAAPVAPKQDTAGRKGIAAGLEKTRMELAAIKQTADEASVFAENIINTVREPLLALDQYLRVVKASRSFYELFKVKPEDTVGQLIYDLGNRQWDIPKLRELLETILPQKAEFDNYEMVHEFAAIGRRVMLLNARQIQRSSGMERIILLAIEDITERRRVELELRQYRETLELQVAKRTAQLQVSNQELESFAYSVSHDLRVPLRAIDGFSKIVIEDYGDKLDYEGRRLLKVIRDNTSKMSKLIDDLLAYSRIGRQDVARETVNMADLARSVVDEVALSNPGRQVAITIGSLPSAIGDQALLRQALVNLVANSFKFTKPKPDAEVEIGFSTEDGVTWYFVKDNGAGFDMRYADKLFGVFQRLHSQEEFEGTGVGLVIAQKVINKHGGKIRGEGEVGKGAAFYFTLPG